MQYRYHNNRRQPHTHHKSISLFNHYINEEQMLKLQLGLSSFFLDRFLLNRLLCLDRFLNFGRFLL